MKVAKLFVFLFPSFFSVPEIRIPIRLETCFQETDGAIRLGIFLDQGELKNLKQLELQDSQTKPIPFWATATAFWPDGSLRWLLLDWVGKGKRCELVAGNQKAARPILTNPLLLARTAEQIESRSEFSQLRIQSQGQSIFEWQESGQGLQLLVNLHRTGKSVAKSALKTIAVVEENPFRNQLEVAGNDWIEEGIPARWKMYLESRARQSGFSAEFFWINPQSLDLGIEDLELQFDLKTSSPYLLKDLGNGLFCLEGKFSLDLFVENWEQLSPLALDWNGQRLRLKILPGKQLLHAGSAISLRFQISSHNKAKSVFDHRQWMDRFRFPAARMNSRTGDELESPKAKQVWREGIQKFFSEMEAHRGLRDHGDHRLSKRRWANLEYDTAAGLYQHFLRSGDFEFWNKARAAIAHWKSSDRIWREDFRQEIGLAAIHESEHNRLANTELGHLWVEGLLLDYAMSGSSSSKQAAIVFGDALVKKLQDPRASQDLERFYAWPIIALAELESFFPQRGYREAMEEKMGNLLAHFQRHPGVFVFTKRMDPEEGIFELNTWLSGGLLLEALDRYARFGGKQEVSLVSSSLIEFLLRESWDAKKNRFFHTVVIEEKTGQILDRRGSLKPVWEIYLLRGIERLAMRFHEKRWEDFAGKAKLRLWENFRWPKQYVGNDLSLLMRTLSD